MKYYANCPVCAHKLMKGENGTQADIRCSRCKNLVRIRIANNGKQRKALPRIGRCFSYVSINVEIVDCIG